MSKFKTALSLIKTPGKLIMPMAEMGLLRWMPDKLYLQIVFHGQTGKRLDLHNPMTYNEKLQWIKLYDRNPAYPLLVDKYEVKKIVSSIIGDEYIIPTIGVWNDPDEIDYSQLPKSFVLKCTHDSGSVIICHDKETFDFDSAKNYLKEKMRKNTYWSGREWPYKNVQPRIIAEIYLEGENSKGVDDYKVLCFHGVPKLIEVHSGRMTGNHTMDYYDTQWNRTNITQVRYPMADKPQPSPIPLSKMLELSSLLSKDYIHIRVDWYVIKEKLYFGELTFFDASGLVQFKDEKWDYLLGQWIQLPEIHNNGEEEKGDKEV